MTHGKRMKKSRRSTLSTRLVLAAAMAAALALAFPGTSWAPPEFSLDSSPPIVGHGYVGSKACKECHTRQYERFEEYSRKAEAFEAVEKMSDGLTPEERQECYKCHTTGYGRPTGFESKEKTPNLADVGCEACHGPGKLHTQTMEMAHIVKTVTIDVCEKCHNDPNAHVKSFRYKSVIYAGAH